jgi:HTH-type transcriptional regulator/antitoxin HigA
MEKMNNRTIIGSLKKPEAYAPMLAIRNVREYGAAVEKLNALVDEIGDNPKDPRYRLVETLTILVEAYDDAHYPIAETSGVEMLKFLMEQHGLSQGDLPEIGSQGVVSEILRGKRELNVRQIAVLSKQFGLPADVFFPKRG